MMNQGVISLPKSDLVDTCKLKVLTHVVPPKHTPVLTPEGPSVNTTAKGKIFSFAAKVSPGDALIDGLRIDWSSPPEAARILVSPSPSTPMHEATGWISTKADGRIPEGGVPQSQNVIFAHPETVNRIELQMRDSGDSSKSQFGVDQIGLVVHQPVGLL